jgi:hypothetical protein
MTYSSKHALTKLASSVSSSHPIPLGTQHVLAMSMSLEQCREHCSSNTWPSCGPGDTLNSKSQCLWRRVEVSEHSGEKSAHLESRVLYCRDSNLLETKRASCKGSVQTPQWDKVTQGMGQIQHPLWSQRPPGH